MNEWLIDWLIDWLNDWMNEWMNFTKFKRQRHLAFAADCVDNSLTQYVGESVSWKPEVNKAQNTAMMRQFLDLLSVDLSTCYQFLIHNCNKRYKFSY